MLFNTFQFILIYLPLTFIGFFVLARFSHQYAAFWLALASLVFYGIWDYHYIPLLLGSIIFNYWTASLIANEQQVFYKKFLLGFAISANLLLLSYYKYANFFISNISYFSTSEGVHLDIVLPIGISFFTFTQIAFLVDTYQGKVKESRFEHYLLFVTYFPHLIAGPVLHHKEMMPQFADSRIYRLSAENIAVGLSIFTLGLAKKVLVADNIAPYANSLFNDPQSPSFFVAWGGVLAYAFQIYFDFSGYSDMAIGLSRLFGVNLPLNFNSPYKSRNIIEFWRRWHMTLSRFLKDYVYIMLGGNRCSLFRRYMNLMVTMLLGGLWHGAGWTFIIWGGLHGFYLIVNHLWQAIALKINIPNNRFFEVSSTVLTFVTVCFSWVFFRASDLAAAEHIIEGMFGVNGVGIPNAIGAHLGVVRAWLEDFGVVFFLGGGANFLETWSSVLFVSTIAVFFPNTQQIMSGFKPALDFMLSGMADSELKSKLRWFPSRRWAIYIGLIAVASLYSLNRPTEFLYFQF